MEINNDVVDRLAESGGFFVGVTEDGDIGAWKPDDEVAFAIGDDFEDLLFEMGVLVPLTTEPSET